MSTHRKIEWSLFILGLLGVAVSGYTSGVKFLSDTCPTTAPCPYVMGYPACYFGFVAFLLVTVFAGLHVFHLMDGKRANDIVLVLALSGTLFAGYLTLGELSLLLSGTFTSCSLGLFIFVALLILALRLRSDFRK